MRVAVIDMGTNSTRLLVADVEPDGVREIERRSTVTRLGRGVDTSGQLASEAIEDVCATVADYIELYRPLEPERVTALATSAVRDAGNGGAFIAELRERFALEARTLDGEAEARLTYLGAAAGRHAAGRDAADRTLIIDIGGGSTELVVGSGNEIGFHTSLQAGTVRHSERHLSHDPPTPSELETLADDVRSLIDAELGARAMVSAKDGIGVAGTPTSLAAIDLGLDPYDPDAVEGHRLSLEWIQHTCSRLSAIPLAERLDVTGLHRDRAPTIVAGIVILIQVMRAFGLSEIEVSEHDILYGAALESAEALAR
jgi:exopolyphosphatase / guanosine-5'-triphosphate,3'-diphosphate pyrophosphatase